MEIREEVTIKFSPEDITEILTEHVKHKGYDVNSVTFSIVDESRGQGMSEHTEKVFKGAQLDARVSRPKQFNR